LVDVVRRWQTWELAELELGVVLVDLFVSRKGANYYLATPTPFPLLLDLLESWIWEENPT